MPTIINNNRQKTKQNIAIQVYVHQQRTSETGDVGEI
jgi:hypothetical protein